MELSLETIDSIVIAVVGAIVSAAASAVIVGIVTFIVARLGSTAKIHQVEHFVKRVELIEKLISLKFKKSEKSSYDENFFSKN